MKTILKNKLQTSGKIFLLVIFCTAFLSFNSCNKDDDNPEPNAYPEENPLALYLKNSRFDQATALLVNSAEREFGYLFKAKVKGKINAITFKMPDNETNVRVTIWDVATKKDLKTIIIPEVTANVEVKQSIDPMTIDPSKEYLISYHGKDYYYRLRADYSRVTYPIDAGSVVITGFNIFNGTTQTYPESPQDIYYAGDVSIVFQQTE